MVKCHISQTKRAAKFCTFCNLSMFLLEVLDHTDEQKVNTTVLIKLIIVFVSSKCFTRYTSLLAAQKFRNTDDCATVTTRVFCIAVNTSIFCHI